MATVLLPDKIKSAECLKKEAEEKEASEWIKRYIQSLRKNPNVNTDIEKNKISLDSVTDLISIPYITIKALYKIQSELAMTHDPKICISKLSSDPCNFLNEKYQLLTLNQLTNIIEHYNLQDDENVRKGLPIAFIFNYFINERKLYIPRYTKIKNTHPNFYNIKSKNIKLISTGNGWYLYDKMEYEYSKFKKDWNIAEWNPSDLQLIRRKDNKRKDKEVKKVKSYPHSWKVPYGEYWTTQRFINLDEELSDLVIKLLEAQPSPPPQNLDEKIIQLEEESKKKLNSQQKEAIRKYFNSNLMILSGLPGTGKSTIVDFIQRIAFNEDTNNVDNDDITTTNGWTVDCPTGKALNKIKTKLTNNKCIRFNTVHKECDYILPKFDKYNINDHLMREAQERCPKNKYPEPLQMAIDYDEAGINPYKYIIIDEASMIDQFMFVKILNAAVQYGSKILLIGDPKQLPPIGAGIPFEILYSIFTNECKPRGALNDDNLYGQIITLTKIERNAGYLSSVIKKMSEDKSLSEEDFDNNQFIFEPCEPKDIGNCLKKCLTKYKLNVKTNCSILSPINGVKGETKYNGSVNHINTILQEELNPFSKLLEEGVPKQYKNYDKDFRDGDPFLRKVNDPRPDKEGNKRFYANGEGGRLEFGDDWEKTNKITLIYDDDSNQPDQEISLKDLETDIVLSYAMTIHKKQGDEDDNIVVIVNNNHKFSWTRDENRKKLIYTAISRAKERCIIIGDIEIFKSIFKDITYTSYSQIEHFMFEEEEE